MNLLRLTDRNFAQNIQEPILVEFSGSWCVPSQQMKPLLESLDIQCGILNVDQNPRLSHEYRIMGCPTFILFLAGKEIKRKVGAQTRQQLEMMLCEF